MIEILNYFALGIGWCLMIFGALLLNSLLCYLIMNAAYKKFVDMRAFKRVFQECLNKGENPFYGPWKGKKK